MEPIITKSSESATFFDAVNTPEQRTRRKIARNVSSFALRMLILAGFTNKEANIILTICNLLWEREGQDTQTPNPVSMARIGRILAPKSSNDESRIRTASNLCSSIFRDAIPRTGCQALTRYKGESGTAHGYVDHTIPAAALYSGTLEQARSSQEFKEICRLSGVEKGQAIEAFELQFVRQALSTLPKCDTEVLDSLGQSYAYMSAPEAMALCENREGYQAKPFTYVPPGNDENLRPFTDEDKKRKEDRILEIIDAFFFDLEKRNSPDEARLWAELFEQRFAKSKKSLLKTAEARRAVPAAKKERERGGRINTCPRIFGGRGAGDP